MAGDFADDAIDRDLNSMFDYDEYEDDEPGYGFRGFFRRRRSRRRRPANQEIFADFVDKPIDPEEF